LLENPLAKDAFILINNRQQSGRRRGRGGQRQNNNSGGGNGRGPESGNRIDNRARGNAAQLLEKYKTLARDAQQSGDRVLTEYYLQFADHYFRVLSETRARYEENNQSRRPQDGASNDENGFEGEEGDEGQDDDDDFGSFRAPPRAQPQAQQRDARPRDDRPRDDRPRDERPRDDRPREDRSQREDRPQRDDRPQREDRSYQRDDRPQRTEAQSDREERPRADDRGGRSGPSYDQRGDQAAPAPRAPRRELRAATPVTSNGHDGEDDARFDVGILPPAIGVAPPEAPADEAAPAPRKRGRPRKNPEAAAPVEG